MKVRTVAAKDAPRKMRRVIPAIMKSAAWQRVQKQLPGLPKGEVLLIELTPADFEELGIKSVRTAARPIKRHMKNHDLPYVVTAINTESGGVIRIANRVAAPAKKRA